MTMDRREFVVGAAAVGAALALPSVLTGCESAPKSEELAAQAAANAPTDDAAAENAVDAVEVSASSEQEVQPQGDSSADAGEGVAVYFTREITPAGLIATYEAVGRTARGKVGVKVSTGEAGGHNYLKPELIGGLVRLLSASILECNTAYGGSRATTESHLQVAADHGFTALGEVDIMDAEGDVTLPVEGGTHLAEDYVGSHFPDYDFVVNLAHFKGHSMAGFGGVIKNASIGIASARGKSWIHSAGTALSGFGGASQDAFLESLAEAAKAVHDHLGENVVYVNVMNNLSVDCDCDAHPADPDMADIGILASADPVALDRACVDLVYAADDGASLVQRMESRNGLHTLDYAERIGLGSQAYRLIEI